MSTMTAYGVEMTHPSVIPTLANVEGAHFVGIISHYLYREDAEKSLAAIDRWRAPRKIGTFRIVEVEMPCEELWELLSDRHGGDHF